MGCKTADRIHLGIGAEVVVVALHHPRVAVSKLGRDIGEGGEDTYPFLIAKEAKLVPLWIPSFGASARIASAMAEGARCP